MAFDLKGLQPVGGSARGGRVSTTEAGKNARTYWQYSSTDPIATIAGSGYFNPVRDLLNKFDAILIASSSKNLRWTSILTAPKSPSTSAVTISTLDLDAA